MDEEQPPAWFIESQRGDFKVGDDVYIVLSECHHHGTEEHGAMGLVVATDSDYAPPDAREAHCYEVYFRNPLSEGRKVWFYCASELRPFNPFEVMKLSTP